VKEQWRALFLLNEEIKNMMARAMVKPEDLQFYIPLDCSG
jgi:hypothetical protein